MSRKIFSDHWNVARAPVAGDIIWEHLSVDHESWWARAVLINTLLFIFVLFLTTPTVALSTLHELEASIGQQPFVILYFLIIIPVLCMHYGNR